MSPPLPKRLYGGVAALCLAVLGAVLPTASAQAARRTVQGGRLDWGIKSSFQSYVTGPIAKGEITTSAGATQAADNGVFAFVKATGEYDTDADTLSAAFEGAVNFKGHEENGEYGLDLTLSDLKATLGDGTGELTADVTSLGEKSQDVVLADLQAEKSDLTASADVITVDDVEATLTEAGAEAFGGFCTAGTELDPVDLAVALTDDVTLPGDDDSGSTSSPSASASTSGTTGSTTGGVSGGLADTGSDVPVGALGAAAAVTVAAGAGVVFAMRRRRTDA